MKPRYAAFLPIALLVPACFGQSPFEYADQRTFQVSYRACSALGDGWVVSGDYAEDDGSPGHGMLRAFDAAGEPAWESQLVDGFNQVYASDLATLPGGDLITASNLIECDVLVPWFLAERRTPMGDLVWSRHYAFPAVGEVAVNAGDSVAFATDAGLLITNAAGDSLTSFETGSIRHLAWDAPHTLLMSGWSGTLWRWSIFGDQIAGINLPAYAVDVRWWRGHRMALTSDGWLRTYTADLGAMDSVAVGPPSYNRRLLPLGDQLIVADNTISLVLDTNLEVVASIGMDPGGEFPDDLFQTFAVNEDAILQVASAATAQRPAGLVRTVSLNGAFVPHGENVRIEVLGFDSVYYEFQSGMIFPHADVTVRVTNLSSSVLNEVMVSHFLSSGPICGTAGTSLALENAALAMGAHVDVSLTNLWLNYAPWGWLNTDQLVCIGALSPNNLYDRDPSDNYACDTAHIVLGSEDLPSDVPGLVVQNPFDGVLGIFFATPSREPLHATLFDATGRDLAAITVPAGSTRFLWDLPGLSGGVHVLLLEGRSVSAMRKLVQQHP